MVREIKVVYGEEKESKGFIKSPVDAVLIYSDLRHETVEKMVAVYVDSKNEVLGCSTISQGGISSTLIDPKVILRNGLLIGAVAFLIIHNHPSGTPTPSREDNATTENMKKASELIGMTCLDLYHHGCRELLLLRGETDQIYSNLLRNALYRLYTRK